MVCQTPGVTWPSPAAISNLWVCGYSEYKPPFLADSILARVLLPPLPSGSKTLFRISFDFGAIQYRVKSLGFERDRRVSPPNLSTYHYFQLTMPRQPLRGISGNSNYKDGIAGRFELTPHWRSHILGRYSDGQCQKTISEDLNIHPSTICNIII